MVDANKGFKFPQCIPWASLYVTISVLARALTNLGLQNQISAETLYHALEAEIRGRDNQSHDHSVSIPHSSPTSSQPPTQ
jgi:hypothetical protein